MREISKQKSQRYFMTALAFLILSSTGQRGSAFDCILSMQLVANNSRLERNNFIIDRVAGDYIRTFGPRFVEDVNTLSADSHWLESGAGKAFALKELSSGVIYDGKLVRARSRFLTALAFKKPFDFDASGFNLSSPQAPQFKYLDGKYIEDRKFSEIGVCDLITDFFGPFSYTAQIDLVLQKYLELLRVGGKAYIHFSPQSTKVNGHPGGIVDYLNSIKGVSITPLDEKWSTVRIEKTAWTSNDSVPPLKLNEFWSDPKSVPMRRYLTNF